LITLLAAKPLADFCQAIADCVKLTVSENWQLQDSVLEEQFKLHRRKRSLWYLFGIKKFKWVGNNDDVLD